ncbi:hypothetical protein AX16_003704 [Volvariella volvacea WC 439]|nr:hypothetical protein AX16_003704 [Volvariella volvacea WC 439]
MCPVLDFANHTTNRPHTYPTPTDADVWDVPPSRKCKDFGLSSPLNYRVSAGEELYLLYGCHSNRVLFTEYGFVQDIPAEGGFSSDFTGDINLSPWIERLFQERGEVGLGMERVLRDEGYWGDWTMHAAPRPAHPSFRVVIALRLYSLFAHLNTEDSIEADASALDSWRDTVLGKADTISPDNEAAWRKVLLNICEDMIGTARAEMAAEWGQAAWNVPEWFWRMRDNVLALWKEEVVVASAVMSSMERGELF